MTTNRIAVPVLDRGYVILCDHMGSDLTVARRARHIPDAPWREGTGKLTDRRLIHYLMAHDHTSPFEFVEFDFEIKAPIFVARQWTRHRTWNYNEISARYQELPAEFYVPGPEHIGEQATLNRQGRDLATEVPVEVRAFEAAEYRSRCDAAFREYQWLLEQGWPRELARGVLPLSTYTVFSGKVDLHNLFRFLTLRLDAHAQLEIRVYADAILQLIEPIVPVCVAAWRRRTLDAAPTPRDTIVGEIEAIIAKLDTVHVDRLHVSKDYTLGDLRNELLTAIGMV